MKENKKLPQLNQGLSKASLELAAVYTYPKLCLVIRNFQWRFWQHCM